MLQASKLQARQLRTLCQRAVLLGRVGGGAGKRMSFCDWGVAWACLRRTRLEVVPNRHASLVVF